MALQAASVICLSFFSASEFSSLLLLPCRLITIIVDDMVIKTMVAISSINVNPFLLFILTSINIIKHY